MIVALTAVAAFLASVALSGLVRRVALRNGAVVPPRADRWHSQPTATLGGIGIAAATLLVFSLARWVVPLEDPIAPALVVSLGGLAMFAVGFADDRLQLSPLAKLVASLAVGAFVVFGLSAQGPGGPPWLNTVTAIVWFGGVVHALNLLDNMDGLAAGVGALAAGLLAWVFAPELGASLVLALASVAGGLVGFLVWNRFPARLFMGDCGSLFIGAMLAGASLVPVLRPDAPFVFDGFVAGLVLVVPLFDTAFVLVLRRLAGRPATRGGTDHVSHRLASLGLSQRSAVRTLYALGLLGGLTAAAVRNGSESMLPLAGLFAIAVVLAGIYLARAPAYDAQDFLALQKSSFAPFLKDLTFRWHAGEVLLDLVLIAICYYASYLLRFEDQSLAVFLPSFAASLPVVLGCKLVALYGSGLYSRSWSTFGLRDLFAVVRGVGLGSLLSVLVVAYVYRFERFSRGVFMIDAALLFLAVVATRASFRVMGEAAMSRSKRSRRVLIYGAGNGGQLLVREMRANVAWNMNPIAYIDDDPAMQKRWILGVPVKGSHERLEEVLRRHKVDTVVLSSHAINGTRELFIRDVCDRAGVPVKRLYVDIK